MDQPNNSVQIEPSTEQSSHIQTLPDPAYRKSVFKPDFKWNLESFDEESALKNLSRLANENLGIEKDRDNPKLYVAESSIKSNVLNKEHIYILRGESEEWGKLQIIRKYSDFHVLRQILLKRWPGVFIPPIPEKGNIGTTEKQITKNKMHIIKSFLNSIMENQALSNSQEMETFVKSNENDVEKNLEKLKPHSLQNLYGVYKAAFPRDFQQMSEENINILSQRIKDFENYFGEMKKDLAKQKDQIKRLAQLRTKLAAQRYLVLQKSLPEYESVCLSWFHNKHNVKKEEKEGEQKQENKQNQGEDQDYRGIFSNPKYQSALQAYKSDLFPQQEGQNDDWLIYELFKFELREIQAILQTISQYRYIGTEKNYFQRNIEGNKQQLEDINNKKVSLKILLLSGSEDQKRTQLANEIQTLQTNYKIAEELWNAVTQHVISEIEKFQVERCQFYKRSLMRAFKKQAVYMAKFFALCVQTHKI